MITTFHRAVLGLVSVVALLACCVLILASREDAASAASATGPVKLVLAGCNDDTCRSFPIAQGASINAVNLRVRTVDGEVAGRSRCSCVSSGAASDVCDMVVTLRATDRTQQGTITASGLFRPLADDGRVNTYAVTGGTGAYTGARGTVTEGWDNDRGAFVLTLRLLRS